MRILIRAGVRGGDYPNEDDTIPTVEVVLGGLVFHTDAESPAHARELVVRTAQAVGLDPPCTCEGCVSPALACTCHPSLEVACHPNFTSLVQVAACPSSECQIRKLCTGHAGCTGEHKARP